MTCNNCIAYVTPLASFILIFFPRPFYCSLLQFWFVSVCDGAGGGVSLVSSSGDEMRAISGSGLVIDLASLRPLTIPPLMKCFVVSAVRFGDHYLEEDFSD